MRSTRYKGNFIASTVFLYHSVTIMRKKKKVPAQSTFKNLLECRDETTGRNLTFALHWLRCGKQHIHRKIGDRPLK